jgi:hypothetical protein
MAVVLFMILAAVATILQAVVYNRKDKDSDHR